MTAEQVKQLFSNQVIKRMESMSPNDLIAAVQCMHFNDVYHTYLALTGQSMINDQSLKSLKDYYEQLLDAAVKILTAPDAGMDKWKDEVRGWLQWAGYTEVKI